MKKSECLRTAIETDWCINRIGINKTEREPNHKLLSKYEVTIRISGMLDDGLGILTPYKKDVSFLMEPTVKQIKI